MKRKILSLALTLMMIVSVAAAMPVSAEDTNYVINATTPTVLDTADGKWTNLTSGYAYFRASEQALKPTVPDGVDWVTDAAYAFFNNLTGKISCPISVQDAGYYDILIAAGSIVNSEVTIYIDGTKVANDAVLKTADTYEGGRETVGVFELPSIYIGENAETFELRVKPAAYTGVTNATPTCVYNLKLNYSNEQDYRVDVDGYSSDSNTSVQGSGTTTTTSTTAITTKDVNWATHKARRIFQSCAGGFTTTFTTAEAGFYDVWVAAGVKGNSTVSLTIDSNEAGKLTGTLAATTGTKDVKGNLIAERVSLTADTHDLKVWLTKANSSECFIYTVRFIKSDDQTVAAQYTITATADPVAGGTVTPTTTTVEENTEVTLTATPNKGYLFDGWIDEDGAPAGGTAEITVTATEDKDFTAKFKISPYIDVPLNGSSTINGNPYSNQTGSTTTTTPTGDVEWATPGGMYIYTGSKYYRGFIKSFEVLQAGYYDVYVAAGVDVASPAQVYVGGDVIEGTLDATESSSVAAASKMDGSVYLKKGTNSVTLYVSSQSTNGCKLYDMRFERCEVQPADKDIIINAANWDGKTYIDSYTFRAIAEDKTTGAWTPTGALQAADNTYSVYVPTSGYYDVYVSAATNGPSAKYDIFANGVKYADDACLTDSETTGSYDVVAETHVAKVYLKAGDNVIKYGTGYQSQSGCWLYGLKLSKTDDTLTSGSLKLVGNGGFELSETVYKDTMVYGEIVTTQDAKIYVVNYQGSGDTKRMVDCTEGTAVVTDNGLKIIRTSSLKSVAGTVKAFLWTNDGECIPLSVPVEITVTNPPAAE